MKTFSRVDGIVFMYSAKIYTTNYLLHIVHPMTNLQNLSKFHPALKTIPVLSDKRIAIRVSHVAERTIRDGHPWLFENSISEQSHAGVAGDLAVIFDRKRRFLAIGLYDPASPIRVRLLHYGSAATINDAWFQHRLADAAQIRSPLAETHTTGYRLVHGENDGLPGLVIDRYDSTLVIKLYSAAWVPHLHAIVAGIHTICQPNKIILRLNRSTTQMAEAGNLSGLANGMTLFNANSEPSMDTKETVHERVQFLENGLRFEADPVHGQKTGFFLDQRENRARLEKLTAGKNVLNVFAYSGGFSLYAARGGAKRVTSLDLSRGALADATRNFELNQNDASVAAASHYLLQGDAFELMTKLHQQEQKYDTVVIDPPSFAKSQNEVAKASAAYYRLTQLGLKLLTPKGIFVQASCSSRIDADIFFRGIHQAANDLKRPLRELDRTFHALDHPIGFKSSNFNEGAYLKCLFATLK